MRNPESETPTSFDPMTRDAVAAGSRRLPGARRRASRTRTRVASFAAAAVAFILVFAPFAGQYAFSADPPKAEAPKAEAPKAEAPKAAAPAQSVASSQQSQPANTGSTQQQSTQQQTQPQAQVQAAAQQQTEA